MCSKEDVRGDFCPVDNSGEVLEQGGACPSPPDTLAVPPQESVTSGGVGRRAPAPRVKNLPLETYQAIAKFLGVSRMTLFCWLKLKPFPKAWRCPYYCHNNRHLKVDVDRIQKWLRALRSEHPLYKAHYLWTRIIQTWSVT